MSFSFNKFLSEITARPDDDGRVDGPLQSPAPPPILQSPKGTSPHKVAFTKAEDFIAAAYANLNMQQHSASSVSESVATLAPNMSEADYVFKAMANVSMQSNSSSSVSESNPIAAGLSEEKYIFKAKVPQDALANVNSQWESETITTLAPGMSEAEYVFKALSRVPPDMRYQVIPSLVKNLTLKTYGEVRVSDCISSPIMSVRCQPDFSARPETIENAAAQVLEANFDANTQPSTNIEGLVSTVLSLTQAFRKIEDIAAVPQSKDINIDGDSKKLPLTADDIVEIVGPIKFEEDKPKVWREGMQMNDSKDDSSKTVFMTQNLNKQYEKDDVKKSRTSFEIATAKIERECAYFTKILEKAGSDMCNTEYSLDPIRVLDVRQKVKENLKKLKDNIDLFISSNLEGDIRDKPLDKVVGESASNVNVEYVYPNEKKLQGKEQKIVLSNDPNQSHVCTDCKEEISIADGSNLEEELLKHSHGSATPVPKPTTDKKDRKTGDSRYKRIMYLNKLVPCLIDDTLISCVPCGLNFEADNAKIAEHMESEQHNNNLNQYNVRVQRELILQNPDIFGPQKLFQLTDLHIVMNKIFVDPLSKYAYCGLCKKELPPRQQNVDEHIKSKGHDKLLLEFLEGKNPTIISNRTQIPVGTEVRTAQILDVTEQSSFDVSQLEKLLDGKPRRKNLQSESNDDPELASSSSEGRNDHILRMQDKKLVCLICDVRNIANNNALDAHHSGALHKKNLDASKSIRGGLTPEQQTRMIQNGVAVSYGKLPLIFECLACNASYANYETMVRHFSGPHAQNLARFKTKQLMAAKKTSNIKNAYSRVILHRNGVEFWCFKCRATLSNITVAFEHVKIPGHEETVDGVKYTTATQFYCNYCMVKINGERNVGEHIMGPKHKAFANPDAANSKLASPTPSFSRAQVKKQKDEKNAYFQVDQYRNTPPYQQQGMNTSAIDEGGLLLQKNGVVELPNGLYDCGVCGSGPITRSEIFFHIFAFQHVAKISKFTSQ